MELGLLWCNIRLRPLLVLTAGIALFEMLLVALFRLFFKVLSNQTTQTYCARVLKITKGPSLWSNSNVAECLKDSQN